MDANQARSKAKSVIEEKSNAQIKHIEALIENEVAKGKFSLNYYFHMFYSVIEHFKGMGYSVKTITSNPNEQEYEISWEDEND